MIMIQDDPLPTGADKPLRITGDPQKVQVSYGGALSLHTMGFYPALDVSRCSPLNLDVCVRYSKPVNSW